jgi:hypothetical protein
MPSGEDYAANQAPNPEGARERLDIQHHFRSHHGAAVHYDTHHHFCSHHGAAVDQEGTGADRSRPWTVSMAVLEGTLIMHVA